MKKLVVCLLAILGLFVTGCCLPRAGLKNIGEVRYSVATLEISVNTKEGWRAIGSGTVFGISKHVALTAGHVCSAYSQIKQKVPVSMKVRYDTGASFILDEGELSIIKLDTDNDLCMVYQHKPVLHALSFASEGPELGDKLFIYGAPLGIPAMLTEGYYSHEMDCGEGDKVIPCFWLSTPAFGGNSGGPIFNQDGKVVGMLVAGVRAYPHVSVGVPLQSILTFIGQYYED